MRITAVEAAYPNYRHLAPSWRTHFWQIVVKVDTDVGVSGYGYGGGGVASVEVVNRQFRELLVGRDLGGVDDIPAIWDDLYRACLPFGRKGIAIMALSGVDLALWDLIGKAEGMPVHELIGPRRKSKVRAYATGEDAETYKAMGFTAHKIRHRWTGSELDYAAAVASASAARETFGAEATLMFDCYMSWDAEVTRGMAELLADFGIYWFEDVLTPDDLEEQAKLRPLVKPVLLAGGEHEFTHHGFAEVARAEALDLWQPDLTWCGGITAGLRILELASRYDVPVVPHRGGEVWGLHVIVATECEDLAETMPERWREPGDLLWFDEPEAVDGFIEPTDAPGFGVTLNEAML